MRLAILRCSLVVVFLLVGASLAPGAAVKAQGVGKGNVLVVRSPDRRLAATIDLDAAGVPGYTVSLEGKVVLQRSRLGLVREDADFSRGLALISVERPRLVEDRYEVLTAKRRMNVYRASRGVVHLKRVGGGERLDITFQVSNDGVAFRYTFPDSGATGRTLTEETTSFHFLPGTRAWLQPIAVAKSGWSQANPSYEEKYLKDIPVGEPSPTGAGWVYPALFRSGGTWLLVSETGLDRAYAGTRLRSESPAGEYTVGFPDPKEKCCGGGAAPTSRLPWTTPWRVVVVGKLGAVAESMLGVDLARPARQPLDPSLPGKASWSWPLLGDPNTTYETQKRFIDYAADMHWRYCLIDALWDKQIGYERVAELAAYARTRGVRILLWYNSAGDWNTTPQTPRDRMLTHESRLAEFQRLKDMGVAGVKVDFFGGDGQSVMNYYQDILEDGEPFGLVFNFHGATLPRGWARTYPHLMTMEGIRGEEYVTFEQANADEQPAHATMLPFTRNVFDPMDFTPVVLDRINRIERRTTVGFELALSVLFTSGIQHYAEIPEGMAKAPDYVRAFLRDVPVIWDDVKFLAGDPGHFVVLARRSGTHWYVAGINGDATARTLTLDLRPLGLRAGGTLISDGGQDGLGFRREPGVSGTRLTLTLQGHGGFVASY